MLFFRLDALCDLLITGVRLLLQLLQLRLGGIDLRLDWVVLFFPGIVITGSLGSVLAGFLQAVQLIPGRADGFLQEILLLPEQFSVRGIELEELLHVFEVGLGGLYR